MLIEAKRASLLLVDMQERLLPAMDDRESIVGRSAILLRAAKELGLPVTASEQYPRGLGHTVAELRDHIGNGPVFEKTAFSCWREDALKARLTGLHETGRPQVIVAGIEAHVCVLQTAIDLAQAGFAVFAVADAISSRKPSSVALAVDRMRMAEVAIINTEMAIFELLGQAGTAEFKSLSALIR
jgi:nicotinamidase-related amidase